MKGRPAPDAIPPRGAIFGSMYESAADVYAASLAEIRAAGLEKTERQLLGAQGAAIRVGGADAPVLNFCANNYLGLSSDPRVLAAAHAALDAYGYGLSSVRFICGTQDAHKRLEGAVARFLGMEDAILYSSCFDANGGLFETLLDERDAIVSDALNHASIIDGIRLCRADRHRYPHGDMAALEAALQATQSKRLRMIATDGVFSMDGDVAPLERICDLADRYRALVMVDDSHATGFLGKTGRGSFEHCGVAGRVDIVTSTLGKALGGAAGGFTASRREVIALLRQRSRPYLFSNSLPPAIVGASLAVIELLERGGESGAAGAAAPAQRVMDNAKRFRDAMTRSGFRIQPGFHPIVPVMMSGPRAEAGAEPPGPPGPPEPGEAGDPRARATDAAQPDAEGGDARLAQAVAAAMLEEGVYVIGFSFPVVPRGQARIRVQLSAAHTPEMVDRAVDAFVRVGKRFELI
jgi:glycine C-acetyltransferase